MLKRGFTNFAVLALTLSVTPLLLGCGSDEEGNGGTGPNVSAFVGSWSATVFVVDGTDVVAGGTAITFTFTETTYSSSVTGDTTGFFCDPGVTSCGDSGDLDSTSGSLIFDPGTGDEVSLTFNITGDVLTVSGTVDGTTISATFQKL